MPDRAVQNTREHQSRSGAPQRRRAARILAALERAMASPQVELEHHNPLELLIATILSAQCTDQRVNQVTPRLFKRYRTAADYARARTTDLEPAIRSTGFFNSKARNIIACCRALLERYGGTVPATMDELVTLPGVGRKTANVVLGQCFGKPGVVVDTHVKRVSQRLDLATSQDPDKIEIELQALIPRSSWTAGSQRLLLHGRYTCLARRPQCHKCPVYLECRWEGKQRR